MIVLGFVHTLEDGRSNRWGGLRRTKNFVRPGRTSYTLLPTSNDYVVVAVVRKDIADLVAAVETAQREAQRAVQSAQREAEKASAAQPASATNPRVPLSASRPSPIPLSTPPFFASALSPGPLTDGLGTLSAARTQPRHWHSLLAST